MERSLHNRIFASTNCLSEELLLKYSRNALAQKEKHKVEKHLLECELCSDALEGFAAVPASSEGMSEVRSRVRGLTEQGKSISIYNWRRLLLAASLIGIAFIPFYFLFQKNKEADENILAENKTKEQTPPSAQEQAEEILPATIPVEKNNTSGNQPVSSSGENDIPKEERANKESFGLFKNEKKDGKLEKTGTKIISDQLAEVKQTAKPDKANDESLRNTVSELHTETTAMISSNQNIVQKDESVSRATTKTSEEPPLTPPQGEDISAAEKIVTKEIVTAGQAGTTAADMQSLTWADKDAGADKRAEEQSKKKSEESSASGKTTPAKGLAYSQNSAAKVASPSAKAKSKYIDNNKVVDYSEEYNAQDMVRAKNLSAEFETLENEKKATTEQNAQVKIVYYEDVLKDGLSKLESADYGGALEKFNLLLKYYPGDLNAVFYSGLANYNLGNYDKALADFNIATSSKNNTFYDEGNWYKALTYRQKNETAKARAMFKEISGKENFYKKKAQDMLESMDK